MVAKEKVHPKMIAEETAKGNWFIIRPLRGRNN